MRDIEKITSRDNRRLANARKIRDGKEPTRIFVEGRRLAEEALRSKLEFDECFVVEGFRGDDLIEAFSVRTDRIAELPERIFQTIADTNQPQGIVVIAKRPETSSVEIESRLPSGGLPIVVFLKEVNNPSNLGAILRTAEAADVAGVILSEKSADVFSPKALRAAMGASFRLPIWENVRFTEVLEWANRRNLITTASDISDGETHIKTDWTLPRLLIFGSEAHGLDETNLASVSEKIRIPMANEVESLNLAVSAGIILFEAKRQNS